MPLGALYRTQGPQPVMDPTRPFFPENWKKALAKVPLSVGPGRSIQKAMGKEPKGPNLRDAFEMMVPQNLTDVALEMVPVGALAGGALGLIRRAAKAGGVAAVGSKTARSAAREGAEALGRKVKKAAEKVPFSRKMFRGAPKVERAGSVVTDGGYYGSGRTFTSSEGVAEVYAKRTPSGVVKEETVDLANPFTLDFSTPEAFSATKTKARELGLELNHNGTVADADKFTEKLRSLGHDGVVVKPQFQDEPLEVVVFPRATVKTGKALGKAGKAAYEAPSIASRKVKKVFHGTPHTFAPAPDNPLGKFDLSKVGTGEGGQAFGHGIYQAENIAVGKGYRKRLSDNAYRHEVTVDGVPWRETKGLNYEETAVLSDIEHYGGVDAAIANLKKQQKEFGGKYYGNQVKLAEGLRGRVKVEEEVSGSLYESLIPDEDDYLLLDEPLSKQSPKVKKALKELGYDVRKAAEPDWKDYSKPVEFELFGSEVYDELSTGVQRMPKDVVDAFESLGNLGYDSAGQAMSGVRHQGSNWKLVWDVLPDDKAEQKAAKIIEEYRSRRKPPGSPKEASELLLSKGVRGNKFLDQGSRNLEPIFWVVDKEGKRVASEGSRDAANRFIEDLGPERGGDLSIREFAPERTYNYVMFDDKDVSIIKMLASIMAMFGAGAAAQKAEAPTP